MPTLTDRVQDLIRLNVSPEDAQKWANEENKAGKRLTWPQFAKTQKSGTADILAAVPAQRYAKRTYEEKHLTAQHTAQEVGNAHKLTNQELADKLATMARIGTRAYNAAIRSAIMAEAADRVRTGKFHS